MLGSRLLLAAGLTTGLTTPCLLASEYLLPEQDETFHFLRGLSIPKLDIGGGLAWRNWSRESDTANFDARGRSKLNEHDETFAYVQGGFRADWLRLSGRWLQGIEELDESASWGLLARMDFIFDGSFDPLVLRLEADVQSAEADIDYTIDNPGDTRSETTQDRRYTQRWALNVTGGDWRFAGAYTGFFWENDRTPSAVTFLQGGNQAGYAVYDSNFEMYKWGVHAGYDWLENRAWRRGPYLGPFVGGKLSWSYVSIDPSSEARQEALQATDTDFTRRRDYWQWDGHINAGFMWQDGSRKAGGTVLQVAAGAQFDWLFLFDSSLSSAVDDRTLLIQYDLDGWQVQGFAQIAAIF